ncbi:MAG: enoyl-CoA hydratase [Hyphomicrobiales bacterium]|nr:enoyl-CoA hydratase [Hyphomicrobiales bacterium]
MTDLIIKNLEKGILRLTLNSPQNRNALSEPMIEALNSIFDEASSDQEVRVIILGASGPAFCSGHDLREMTKARQLEDGGQEYYLTAMAASADLMKKTVRHRLPIIADIRGIAAAAGCQLAASCDLVIASEDAQFATPGVNIGLFCSTPMVALSRTISSKHAMEMLLCGELIDAKRAEQIGLVNRVVETSRMDEVTQKMAEIIAGKSSMTIETGKTAFYRQLDMNLDDAYDYTTSVMAENMMKNDACEGINAFIEKRPPEWSDS